ncbi:hypothetical protein FQR65_LT16604 [Abscondita terminalis]|nr:hypothetical protein FQR65_LT16604 [Abscondita terminalis]
MVASQLRKLNKRNQAIAKNRIQNMLSELEMDELTNTQLPPNVTSYCTSSLSTASSPPNSQPPTPQYPPPSSASCSYSQPPTPQQPPDPISQLKQLQLQTGGGPPEKPLTDLEDRLINILGKVLIEGLSKIPKIGILNKTPGPTKVMELPITSTKPSLKRSASPLPHPTATKKTQLGAIQVAIEQNAAHNKTTLNVLGSIN